MVKLLSPVSPLSAVPRPDLMRRVAVMSGAAGGLSAAYGRRLARDGLAALIADLAEAGEAVSAIRADGGGGWAGRCDITPQGPMRNAAGIERGMRNLALGCDQRGRLARAAGHGLAVWLDSRHRRPDPLGWPRTSRW